MRFSAGSGLSVLALAICMPTIVQANSYRLVDLGSRRFPLAINGDGELAGYGGARFGVQRPLKWDNGHWRKLNAKVSGEAHAIDDAGTIGGSDGASPVTWTADGKRHELKLPAQSLGGYVTAVSGSVAVGDFSPDDGEDPHCFAGDTLGGEVRDIGAYPGGSGCQASGINASGQVAASVAIDDMGTPHASIWQDGAFTDLGTLFGEPDSLAAGINAAGHVVGWSGPYPFLWKDGVMSYLGLSDGIYRAEAWAINSADTIVGVGVEPNSERPVAVRFEGGVAIELETEVSNLQGWRLMYAYGVNDDGVIVGSGWKDGGHRGFMLTPSDGAQRLTK